MLIRSKLFVPASRPELFEKAALSQADSLSFDLEDAVDISQKGNARAHLVNFLNSPLAAKKRIIVRVNALTTPFFEEDMKAVAHKNVSIINQPMINTPHEIQECAKHLAPHASILVNIETPRALRLAGELATASSRNMGLQIGYADLLEPTTIARKDEAALSYLRLQIRFAAAEAGIIALDGAYGKITDLEGYKQECFAAKAHGFVGKSCIHPTQIEAANAVFMPSKEEIAQAEQILAAAMLNSAKGVGAYTVNGQMIDAPFLTRARAIIAFRDKINALGAISDAA